MIIGLDASRANKSIKTGVEWYSYHIINQFKTLDADDRFFLYTSTPLQGDLARLPTNFHQALLKWPFKKLWTVFRLSWEMKFGKYKPDVLFVSAHTLPWWLPKRAVVTVHDVGYARFPELYQWADKFYHKWSTRFIKKHAQSIITISEFSKREIMEFYQIPAEKIQVTVLGYDHEVYKQYPGKNVPHEIKTKFGLVDPYFMFVGRWEAKKNIARLIEAFGEFKKKYPRDLHKLVLIGKPGFGFDVAEMLIDQYQIKDHVIRLNYLPAEDISLLYAGALALVFPSLYEGFGIPPIEAMASGCPVVCSNTTSLPEVVGDAAIKFNPEKVELITKAMETVAFNEDIRQGLIAAGLEQCQKFSWQRCAEETLTIVKGERG